MVKGCRKQMVWLKNTGSEWFEEAYFIVSDGKEAEQKGESELLREANRIVSQNAFAKQKRPHRPVWTRFGWGMLGAAVSGTGFLLFFLLTR